jgi:signal transduction histidine kinase
MRSRSAWVLHNAAKHACAGRLRLRFTRQDDRLVLDVGDDGVGFDPTALHPDHLGLHSMRERATRAGGILTIDSAPGRGTCVHAEFALHAEPPHSYPDGEHQQSVFIKRDPVR